MENRIKEANKDIGITAYPPGQWAINSNHFEISIIAYNLNRWVALFEREESLAVPE